jgi:hypothetical protein
MTTGAPAGRTSRVFSVWRAYQHDHDGEQLKTELDQIELECRRAKPS